MIALTTEGGDPKMPKKPTIKTVKKPMTKPAAKRKARPSSAKY